MHLIPKSTPYLCHLSIFAVNMSQLGYNLTCGNCNNWAYSCICRAQGEALYMSPISYYHPPSSNHDVNFSHLTPTSGSKSSSHSIPLAQGHSNHSQIINTTHPVVNNQPSSSTQKCKASAQNSSSSKWQQASKENTSPNTSTTVTKSSLSPAVPGAGPSSRPVNIPHIEHPAFYKTSQAQHETQSSTSQITSKSAASDAWWFVWPYDTNKRPSEPPPLFPDSCKSRTRHKADYVGCLLCLWSVMFSIKCWWLVYY